MWVTSPVDHLLIEQVQELQMMRQKYIELGKLKQGQICLEQILELTKELVESGVTIFDPAPAFIELGDGILLSASGELLTPIYKPGMEGPGMYIKSAAGWKRVSGSRVTGTMDSVQLPVIAPTDEKSLREIKAEIRAGRSQTSTDQ